MIEMHYDVPRVIVTILFKSERSFKTATRFRSHNLGLYVWIFMYIDEAWQRSNINTFNLKL